MGGSHERRRRAGTENVPGIVGLAKAAELAMHSLEDGTMADGTPEGGTMARLARLRDRLEAGILQLPGTGVNGAYSTDCHPERAQRVEGPAVSFPSDNLGAPGPSRLGTGESTNPKEPGTWESTPPVPRVANTTNIWFGNLEGEALVIALDLKGVAVSGGSACHSGATEPSHVLMAMGVDKTRARASLRFSLLKTATEADVDYVLKVVPEAVEHLRAISPVAAGTAG